MVGASKVEYLQIIAFSPLYSSPEQQVGSSKAVAMVVGSTVLVDYRVFIPDRQNRRDGLCILKGYLNDQGLAKAVDQILEPLSRLRGNMVAASGKKV